LDEEEPFRGQGGRGRQAVCMPGNLFHWGAEYRRGAPCSEGPTHMPQDHLGI